MGDHSTDPVCVGFSAPISPDILGESGGFSDIFSEVLGVDVLELSTGVSPEIPPEEEAFSLGMEQFGICTFCAIGTHFTLVT